MLNEEISRDVKEEVVKPAIRFAIQSIAKPSVKKLLGYLAAIAKLPVKTAINRVRNPKGKMSVKQLLRKDEGAQAVDVDSLGLRDFKRIANKHGVDFAIMKSKYIEPAKYTVFFKAKDRDAIEHVVAEYTAKMLKIEKFGRPSILAKLEAFKKIAAELSKKAVEKMKEAVR